MMSILSASSPRVTAVPLLAVALLRALRSTVVPLLARTFVLSLILVANLLAEDTQRELKTESTERVDAVLLLDSSGSMLQTDPKRLRDEGAKLFLQFLRPEDRIAIMQFDREAKLLRPFSEFSKEEISAIANDIGKVSTEGTYTDLLAGIQAASDLLKKEKRPDASGIVLMLSDGKMEPDPAVGQPYPRLEQLLNSELPALKAAGVRVHTLAFSELSDRKLLSEIAATTDGVGTYAPDADAIHQAFANLFLAVKKPQVLPLTSKGFSIDPDVREATFYVNREAEGEVTLISPLGKEFTANSVDDSIKWFRGGNFDVITISSPQHGDWSLRGTITKDGFATVLTNLKLVSDWPATITAREPTLLQARLNEGEKPVVLREMSGSTRYALQIIPTDKVAEPVIEDVLFDDGTHGDKIPGDGIFSYRVTLHEPGEYKLWIVAKGPTFDRRQQIPFRVKPPLISVSILASERSAEAGAADGQSEAKEGETEAKAAAEGDAHSQADSAEGSTATHENQGGVFKGRPGDKIVVELSPEAVLFRNMEVRLSAVDAARKRYRLPLERAEEELRYEAPAELLPHAGVFDLRAELSAESKKRGAIREQSRIFKYERTEGAKQEDAPVYEVVIEGEEEATKATPSGLLQAAILMLVNLGLGAPLVMRAKSAQGEQRFTLPAFVSADPALAAVAELEGRFALNEVDINDPMFSVEAILPSGAGAVPAAVSAVVNAPVAPPAADDSDGAATGGSEESASPEGEPSETKEQG